MDAVAEGEWALRVGLVHTLDLRVDCVCGSLDIRRSIYAGYVTLKSIVSGYVDVCFVL